MSQIVIVGFVGDSRCRRRVLSRNARRTSSASDVSTNENSTPYRARIFV